MFWTISGWGIALLSLIVNALQLFDRREMNKKLTKFKDIHGDVESNIQSHTGKGHNINVKGDTNFNDLDINN